MYRGRIVETGPTRQLLAAPLHPYTRALVDAVPRIGPPSPGAGQSAPPGPAAAGTGATPDDAGAMTAGAPPTASACAYAPRCPLAVARCRSETPLLLPVTAQRSVACHVTGRTGNTNDAGRTG